MFSGTHLLVLSHNLSAVPALPYQTRISHGLHLLHDKWVVSHDETCMHGEGCLRFLFKFNTILLSIVAYGVLAFTIRIWGSMKFTPKMTKEIWLFHFCHSRVELLLHTIIPSSVGSVTTYLQSRPLNLQPSFTMNSLDNGRNPGIQKHTFKKVWSDHYRLGLSKSLHPSRGSAWTRRSCRWITEAWWKPEDRVLHKSTWTIKSWRAWLDEYHRGSSQKETKYRILVLRIVSG